MKLIKHHFNTHLFNILYKRYPIGPYCYNMTRVHELSYFSNFHTITRSKDI